jgi:hypothetical protein
MTQFKKSSATRKQARKPHPAAPRKPAKPGDSKAPATRVGDGLTHHDTLATRVLYVLVDGPKAPQDALALDSSARPWPMTFTTDAEALYDSTLVFLLAFDDVADTGTYTLKLERGAARATAEIFTAVAAGDLIHGDLELLYDAYTFESKAPAGNRRWLDYTALEPHPVAADDDLDPRELPYASLQSGS